MSLRREMNFKMTSSKPKKISREWAKQLKKDTGLYCQMATRQGLGMSTPTLNSNSCHLAAKNMLDATIAEQNDAAIIKDYLIVGQTSDTTIAEQNNAILQL
ncbi:hypothetical protein V502_00652 [Pseudogymnoascus sp. VKM F-4520 (FW-2644)]|nr:hypothetical protein V502_00652 [Pseudogymnoascus sp. VKM F-4520 (FW-2644)]